jgi:hypothetical protein
MLILDVFYPPPFCKELPVARKKTYYPAKTFDDDLDGLAKLYKAKGWSFSNVDGKQLAQDAISQRGERAEYDALTSKYLHLRETFGQNQEARYNLFASALATARGAFRNDKAVMKELDRFKRSVTRKNQKEPKATKTTKDPKTP